MKIPAPKIFDWLAVLAIAVAVAVALAGGDSGQVVNNESSAVRVEIQRYMGYEILPVRYLSLPYDLTMNINEQLPLLDVGFLLLLFVPVIVMLGLKKWPHLQWAVILSCLLLLIVSTSTGFILGSNMEHVSTEKQALDKYLESTAFSDAPASVIPAFFYKQFAGIYGGIAGILSRISGEKDAVTYPMLLAFFGLFFYITVKRSGSRLLHEQGLLVLVFVYTFFWLILSSGIVWYGFLIFPLLTALAFWSLAKQRQSADVTSKIVLYGFYLLTGVSVLLGFTQRFSNIKLEIVNADTLAGKRLYDPAYLRYQAGDIKEAGVTEAFYPGLTKALDEINKEPNSLIYNVGTRFNFFIRESDKRIFKDNQLDFFHQVQTKYPYKERIIAMLKGAGFKYIMVDLKTPTGDNTPEKTLVNKYKNFMLLLYNNPGIELVATNRVLKETVNGKEQFRYGMFGEAKEFGSYAIFKIKQEMGKSAN